MDGEEPRGRLKTSPPSNEAREPQLEIRPPLRSRNESSLNVYLFGNHVRYLTTRYIMIHVTIIPPNNIHLSFREGGERKRRVYLCGRGGEETRRSTWAARRLISLITVLDSPSVLAMSNTRF